MITSSSRSYFAVHSFNAHYVDWLIHIKRKSNCMVVESCLRINHKTVEWGLDSGSSHPRMQHDLFMALLTLLTIFMPHALGGFPGTLNGEVV